jgi:hypothetical protein
MGAVSAIGDVFSGAANAVSSAVSDVAQGVADVGKGVLGSAKSAVSDVAQGVADVGKGVLGSAKSVVKDTSKFLGPVAAPLETLALTTAGVPPSIAGAVVGGANAAANGQNPTSALITGGLTAGLTAAGVPQQLASPLASMVNQSATSSSAANSVKPTLVTNAPDNSTNTQTTVSSSTAANAPTSASYSSYPYTENITTTPDALLQNQIASIPVSSPANFEKLTPITLANNNFQQQQPIGAFGQGIVPQTPIKIGDSGLEALQMAMMANPRYAAHGGHISGHPTAHPLEPVFKTGHYVTGKGDGQSDDIPAMLADGEYVFDADTVAALGNGSNKAGAEKLDQFREAVRAHKRSASDDKIPPKAKKLTSYLKGI